MSAINLNFTIGAGATVRLPAGRFFMIRTAAGAVDVETIGNPGSRVRLLGLTAGCRFGPVQDGANWTYLQVTSATAQILEFVISDDGVFDVANVVTVAGAVQTVEAPATAITDFVTVNLPNAALTVVVPVNLSRRRVTLSNLSTNTGSVFIRVAGGANNLIEIQPGQSVEFRTTAALSARNDSGASQSLMVFEES